jgi:hypothetical protein
MRTWTLQVSYADCDERASFESRKEAMECAEAILGDYDGSVQITVIDPSGNPETFAPQTATQSENGFKMCAGPR